MSEERVVFIGGGAAGATAALETRKRMRDAKITVIEEGPYPQYSCCALPFVIGGHIRSFGDIILYDEAFYKNFGKIDLMLNTRVDSIDRKGRFVVCGDRHITYDKLVISIGSYAFCPPIPGLDGIRFGKRTFLFKFMPGAIELERSIGDAKSAIVIGAGLVGLEVADALTQRGIRVTIVELLPYVMSAVVDEDMARVVMDHLGENGIGLLMDTKVTKIAENSGNVTVSMGDTELVADVCVVSSGVRAQTGLARDSGLKVGHGIVVDEHMRTSDPNIYSCGDCCETTNAITRESALSQLGSTAVRQAKVVAANLSGEPMGMAPAYNTGITKIGDLMIASVGLTQESAMRSGLGPISVRFKGSDLPEYYPGGEDLIIKLVFDQKRRILGGQVIGKKGVLARINTLSAVMQCGGDLDTLYNLETAYTPPVSPTTDPLSLAAAIAIKKCAKAAKRG